MLEISSRNGSRTDPLIAPKHVSRGCQTEDLINSPNSNPSNPILADKSTKLSNSVLDTGEVRNDLLSREGKISKCDKIIDERQKECLSETKDKSDGTSNGSTSSPGMYHYRYLILALRRY